MSFFNDIRGRANFKENADKSLLRASYALSHAVSTGFTPYYDVTSHARSMAHPLYHVTQLTRNAARLAYGAFVFTGALLTLNGAAAGQTSIGMLRIVLASALEIINTLLSIAIFATKTLASVFNQGYTSPHISAKIEQSQKQSQKQAQFESNECGEQNIDDATFNFSGLDDGVTFKLFCLKAEKRKLQSTDENVHKAAFKLV